MATIFGSSNHAGFLLPSLVQDRVVLYRGLSSAVYPAWWGIAGFVNECVWCIFTAFIVQIPMYFLSASRCRRRSSSNSISPPTFSA